MKIEFENGSVIKAVETQGVVRGNRAKTIKFVEDDDSRSNMIRKIVDELFSNATPIDNQCI